MTSLGDNGRVADAVVFSGPQMITRSRRVIMQTNGFVKVPVIWVQQRIEYDKLLLLRPSVGVNRRRTMIVPPIPAANNQPVNRRRVTFANPLTSTAPSPGNLINNHSCFCMWFRSKILKISVNSYLIGEKYLIFIYEFFYRRITSLDSNKSAVAESTVDPGKKDIWILYKYIWMLQSKIFILFFMDSL